MPDAYLDAAAIRATTFIRHVEIHDTLGSTNDRAAELARDTAIELPALVATRHQTAGRGRGKNTWWSADGALTFSVLLDPAALGISTSNWPQLSLATAVAVCDALARELNPRSEIPNPQSPRLAIKWPNDVMLDGAKLGGILIESPGGASPAKDRLIIGIGVNINNSRHDGAPVWGPMQHAKKPLIAVALCDVSHRSHNLLELLCETLSALDRCINQLVTQDVQLPADWQRLCWLSGQDVVIQIGENTIEGACQGIAKDGALLIRTIAATQRMYGGSVRLRTDDLPLAAL